MKTLIKLTLLLLVSFTFMAWWPYIPETTLKEKKLRGPVKTVIENVSMWDERNVVVQDFNKQGQLTEIRYFRSKRLPLDTTYGNTRLFAINPDIEGLDTSDLEFYRRKAYKYDSKGLLILVQDMTSEDFIYNEVIYNYDSNDSLAEEIYIDYDSNGVEHKNTYNYLYFSTLQLQRKIEIKNNSDTLFILWRYLNKNGKVTKMVADNQPIGGPFVKITLFDYKRNKLLIKSEFFWYDSISKTRTPMETIEFKYNWRNKPIYEHTVKYAGDYISEDYSLFFTYRNNQRKKIKEIDSKKNSLSVWYFDKFGNITKAIDYDSNQVKEKKNYSTTVFNCIYDEHHNWIYRDISDNKEKFYRNITYYK